MMRPKAYIYGITNLLTTIWEQVPDWRFGQLITNLGGVAWNKEYTELVDRFCQHANQLNINVNPNDYLLWGTLGKYGKGPLKYITISEMESDHLNNVLQGLSDTTGISKIIEKAMINELEDRGDYDAKSKEKKVEESPYTKLLNDITKLIKESGIKEANTMVSILGLNEQ